MDVSNVLPGISHPHLEVAMNANHAAFWSSVGEHASDIAELHSDPSIMWLSSDIDDAYPYNLVLPLRLGETEQAGTVSASIERARLRKVHTQWWTSPTSIEDGLNDQLVAQGFKYLGGPAGMAVDLSTLNEDIPLPTNFVIKQVETQAALSDLADTLVKGWPGPEYWRPFFMEGYGGYGLGADRDLRHYVGYVDGAPVTASSVLFAAGVAGIYAVVTQPNFRGRGLGALITLKPLLEAREKGYHVGILQASELGYPVYQRLGFEEVFHYRVYQWSALEGH